jgi:hypothetical protein
VNVLSGLNTTNKGCEASTWRFSLPSGSLSELGIAANDARHTSAELQRARLFEPASAQKNALQQRSADPARQYSRLLAKPKSRTPANCHTADVGFSAMEFLQSRLNSDFLLSSLAGEA